MSSWQPVSILAQMLLADASNCLALGLDKRFERSRTALASAESSVRSIRSSFLILVLC